MTTGTGFFLKYCFACTSNVGSPTKFIVDDNAKVSVLMNLLYARERERERGGGERERGLLPRYISLSPDPNLI